MIDKLPAYMQQNEVTVEVYEGDGAYGPIYSDPVTISCYYQQKNEKVLDDEGDEIISSSQFFTSSGLDMKKGSKVTFEGNTNKVMTTSEKRNALTGKVHHQQVWLR